jgi:hypothetical protein
VADDPRDPLPRLPLRNIVPPLATIGGFLLVVGVFVGLTVSRSGSGAQETVAPPPPLVMYNVADLLGLGPTALAALRDKTVIVRAVIRECRHDSFGNAYVELGRGLGYEVPIIQCFLADEPASTSAPGAVGRFRARVLGMSLGVALQADDCVPINEP